MKKQPPPKPHPYDDPVAMRKAFSLLRASDREVDQIIHDAQVRLEKEYGGPVILMPPRET